LEEADEVTSWKELQRARVVPSGSGGQDDLNLSSASAGAEDDHFSDERSSRTHSVSSVMLQQRLSRPGSASSLARGTLPQDGPQPSPAGGKAGTAADFDSM